MASLLAPLRRAPAFPRTKLPVVSRSFCSAAPRLPTNFLTDEELAIKDMAQEFSEREIAPRVQQMDESATMDPALIRELFSAGLFGIEIPEEYGGAGMSFTQSCIAIQETAKVDPAVSVTIDIQNTLSQSLLFSSPSIRPDYQPISSIPLLSSFSIPSSSLPCSIFHPLCPASHCSPHSQHDPDEMGQRSSEEGISAAVRAGDDLFFRTLRSGERLGCLCDEDLREAGQGRRELGPEWDEDVDQLREGGWDVPCLREREP